MTAIRKADIAAPALLTETVTVEALGGDVTVRGLRLSERATLFREVKAGEASAGFLQQLLAVAVVDADGTPLFSADEWDVWAGTQTDAFAELYRRAAALSGIELEVVQKNS